MNARIAPPAGPGPRYGTPADVAMAAFEHAAVRADGIDPITTELVRLRCARLHDCRRCQSLRDDAALQAGFDERLGAEVDDHERSTLLAEHQRAALALTDALLLTPGHVDPALRDRLRASFSETQIAELLLDVVKWSVQKALVALRIEPAPAEGLSRLTMAADGSYAIGDRL